MDPLTTLLAAAAATGPNTLQSHGFEVRGTSRKLLHAHGESPSAPNAAIGAANNPAAQPDHQPANIGTNCPYAAASHANLAIGISTGRPSTHRASHPNVAGPSQDAATGQPSTRYDADAADSDHTTTGNVAKRPSGVHPGQFSFTHSKAAGAVLAQQRTQHPAAWPSDRGRGTCTQDPSVQIRKPPQP